MKKLLQKLLSVKENESENQPTQQRTPTRMIVQSPPKEDAKKEARIPTPKKSSCVMECVCKDFELKEETAVDLNAVLEC